MHKRFFLLIAIVVYLDSSSQMKNAVKFKDPLYETGLTENILYFSPPDQHYYLLDLYQPKDDNQSKRPLIIWLHGGGFKYGNKKSGGIPLWCIEFAKRGYVCAAINYRLSKKKPLRHFPDLVKGCLEATADLQRAIDFFKTNAAQYRIDTMHIIAGGNSAGAMTALQSAFSSPSEMMELINEPGYDSLSKLHNPSSICAVINFWGALFKKEWLQNAAIPIVSVHGTKDRIVAINTKGPVNGSLAIHEYADSLHLSNALKTFPGFGHELQRHFNPLFAGRRTKKRWKEAGDFAATFLYNQFFRQ
ncbi:MAG: alpha/beta hydrolase [Chitinophagaceae bacterium]